jgi:plasmid maintenance system antidote protein VapI
MNMTLTMPECQNQFDELFGFDSIEKKREHDAQMISFRILSEIEKICLDKRIKRKELADMVGTSASFITQLFQGSKQVNTDMMARFEEIFNSCFEIKLRLNEQTHTEFLFSQICELNMRRFKHKQQFWNRLDCDEAAGKAEVVELFYSKKTQKETA